MAESPSIYDTCVQFGGSLVGHKSEKAWVAYRGLLTGLCLYHPRAGAAALYEAGRTTRNSQGLARCLFAGGFAKGRPSPAGGWEASRTHIQPLPLPRHS